MTVVQSTVLEMIGKSPGSIGGPAVKTGARVNKFLWRSIIVAPSAPPPRACSVDELA